MNPAHAVAGPVQRGSKSFITLRILICFPRYAAANALAKGTKCIFPACRTHLLTPRVGGTGSTNYLKFL